MRRKNYRKIYETHYGKIPFDETGRTYEIHHIDGDHTNNDPSNLVALSIKDHYDVHYSQGDYAACLVISHRMKISPEEKSDLAKAMNNDRVDRGVHHLQDGDAARLRSILRVKNGDHHFLGDKNPNYDSTIYKFKNLDTGITVHLTRSQFITIYDLKRQNIHAMIKGKRKSVKRWVLV